MTGFALLALSQAILRLSLWRAMIIITTLYAWLTVPIVALSSGSYFGVWLAVNIAVLYSLLAIYPSKAIRLFAFVLPVASSVALATGALMVLPVGSVLAYVFAMHSLILISSTMAVAGAAIALEPRSVETSPHAKNRAI